MKKSSKSKYRQEFSGDHHFDYKDPVSLTRFVGDGGKIVPARISKLSISQQKKVAAAVRKARSIGLLPSGMEHYDNLYRQESITPAPFEA